MQLKSEGIFEFMRNRRQKYV